MPRGRSGGSSSGSSRSYVDNSYNRSIGRVGMPVGSMVVSKSSSAGSSYGSYGSSSSGSSRAYVDNAYNRSIGRVGMPVGSMVVSKSSSGTSDYESYGSSNSGSSRTYVDNSYNRRIGRVGMPVGSMVVSKSSSGTSDYESYGSSNSGSSRTYVDNSYNRRIGRVGMPVGSMVVSKSSSGNSDYGSYGASSSSGTYVDNAYNRSIGRVGMPVGSMVVSKSATGSSSVREHSFSDYGKTYVDNPSNRKLGRAGLPVGSLVVSSKNPSPVKRYVDNAMNRRLGRVGKPVGSRVADASGHLLGPKLYKDTRLNRKLGRVGKLLGSMPSSTCSKTTSSIKDIWLQDDEPDWNRWTADLDGMERDYIYETISSLQSRVEQVLEWQRESGETTSKPTTSVELLDDFKGPIIDFNELTLKKKIGFGSFGEVYFAEWQNTVVAVKKLQIHKVTTRKMDAFKREVSLFHQLDHPNIVLFLGACTVSPDLAIVMEYMQCSLFDALHFGSLQRELSETDKINIILQSSKGVEYLHSHEIAHCDIKSSNVLLDISKQDDLIVKLTDFGLSMIKNETESSLSNADFVKNAGTPRYSAPEVLRGELLDAKAMKKTDMYSLSLVVYEVCYEGEPFSDLNYNQMRTQVGQRGMIPEIPDEPEVDCVILVELSKCWDRDPDERPTATDFVKFFTMQDTIYVL